MLLDFKACIDIHDLKMHKLSLITMGRLEMELHKGNVIKVLLHLYTFSHNLLSWWQDIALFI